MNNLISIIKHRGYDVKDFSRQVLGRSYRTFKRQVEEGSMKYNDIVKILDVLGIDFKDLSKGVVLQKTKNVESLSKEYPYKKQTEQKFSEEYGYLIKKPYTKLLLASLMQGDKYLTLKQFCKKYNIVVDFTLTKHTQ